MPRSYKRKTDRRHWNENNIIAAIHAVKEEGMSCNRAAETFQIPESTLRRYLKKQPEDMPIHAGRFRNVFNQEQLHELKAYIIETDRRSFGLTINQCRRLAFDYAEEKGLNHPFNKKTLMAGVDWLRKFRENCNFTLRTPEATSIGRLMGFNEVQVKKFFDILKEVREAYKFEPYNIYNLDESGLSTVPSRQPKVLSPIGTKRVAKIVSAERGKTITVVCAMNAIGSYVPPFIIYPRKRMRPEFLTGGPPGCVGYAQDTGYMTSEVFLLYLQHFVKHTKPTTEKPILLLLDNHASHVSLPAINFCREHSVVMLGFPPHTSHRLQPLDVAFFGPLKRYYSDACDNFMVSHPGQVIGEKDVASLLRIAYLKAATSGNAVSGFSATGIEPYNSSIFSESDFAPAATTNREIFNTNNEMKSDEFATTNSSPIQNLKDTQPGPSGIKILQNIIISKNTDSLSENRSDCPLENKENQPVLSLPHFERPPTIRRAGTASVLTSTPVKVMLEQREIDKQNKN